MDEKMMQCSALEISTESTGTSSKLYAWFLYREFAQSTGTTGTKKFSDYRTVGMQGKSIWLSTWTR